jgi:hypothetical protein
MRSPARAAWSPGDHRDQINAQVDGGSITKLGLWPWDKRPDEVDWDAAAVGSPVRFRAVQFGTIAWYARGPVTVTAAENLEKPAWTVWPADAVGGVADYDRGRRACSGKGRRVCPSGDRVIVGGVARRS